jgi:hypothetical protein
MLPAREFPAAPYLVGVAAPILRDASQPCLPVMLLACHPEARDFCVPKDLGEPREASLFYDA